MTTTTHSPGRGAMIEVEGISKSFGETRALAGVDMSVPAGTVQGLLGPNGAGKTTLVRILATLLAPDTGRARVSGVDVQKDPNTVRSLIGLAGQYAAVDETLTGQPDQARSEEHTSELQSLAYLVCRLLLEKKKKK